MKHLRHILAALLFICAATASAQTIKTLGYNTTNGQVVANTGTNALTFTNTAIEFPLEGVTFGGDLRISNNILVGPNVSLSLEDGSFDGVLHINGGSITFGGTAAATTRTNLGLGATGSVSFEEVLISNAAEVAGGAPGGISIDADGIQFGATNAATTRTNLGLPLAALTNTSNVTMMRELAGSTNTNHPFSGTVSVVGTNNTNTLVFSNGILRSVQ